MFGEAIEISLLARLLENGVCQETGRNRDLITRFEKAGWLMAGTRRQQWAARDGAASVLQTRLSKLLPNWESDFALLRSHGLDPKKPLDIEALPVLRHRPEGQGLINRRNWKAVGGLGPKRKGVLTTDACLTSDWVMRLRPNLGLIAHWNHGQTDLWAMAQDWTECPIPQRLWMHLQSFEGRLPSVVITCENLGAFVDLPLPQDMLAVFSPGKHVAPAIELLNALKAATWIHFGDIDPEGLSIPRQIASGTGRDIQFFIPSFAMEYLENDLAQKCNVMWAEPPTDHPVVKKLAKLNKGMFQEVFMLDARLEQEIAAISRPC